MSLSFAAVCAAGEPAAVEFNRDIRPILSDKCFLCHGPDRASRQADLRLDKRDDALADHDGEWPIVPGRAKDSAVIQRIETSDPDERMPPADSGLKLSSREIELLKRWVDAGAPYQPHWSLIPPQTGQVPALRRAAGAINPIDHFIRARLAALKIAPAPEADKATLLRRVTFDLTGLPPTPEEVDVFA
ncbi:MAG TPA: c-type cytochrome domain-containing protein, partial [Pirellulales bacterium]|nr:c-type cytochrome domain-containing protein [Pirellulales bacterium]